MPKKQVKERASQSGTSKPGVSLSYAAISALVGLLAVAGVIWKVGSAVATKDDVASIKLLITPVLEKHEDRIRSLELQVARYFGASQTSGHPLPSRDEGGVIQAGVMLAQYQQAAPSLEQKIETTRRVVVPDEMIRAYELQPSRGGVYAVLGEDGRLYSLDDVLAVIIRLHLEERQWAKRPVLKR